jgi:hypothetical protein
MEVSGQLLAPFATLPANRLRCLVDRRLGKECGSNKKLAVDKLEWM